MTVELTFEKSPQCLTVLENMRSASRQAHTALADEVCVWERECVWVRAIAKVKACMYICIYMFTRVYTRHIRFQKYSREQPSSTHSACWWGVCVWEREWVCVHVYMNICTHANIYIYTLFISILHIHAVGKMRVASRQAHTAPADEVCVWESERIGVRKCVNVCMSICTHAYIYICYIRVLHICRDIYVYYIYVHVYIYIHIYICIYKYKYM